MQSRYSYCYRHHHLGFMGKEEVGSRWLMPEPSKQINKRSREKTPDYPIPCSRGDLLNVKGSCARGTYSSMFCYLHFKVLALSTLSAWEHVGTANCLWAACLQSISDLVQLQSASLAHLLFPFPAALETLARSVDASAYRQSSASRFHRIPCKTRCIQYSAK